MRTGLITRKLGMSAVFAEDGSHIPVTILELDNCQVVGQRTEEKDGYTAVQLGVGLAKIKNVTKPMRGIYSKAKVEPKKKLAEFRVTDDALIDVGAELTADHFVTGQYVDVAGTTKGKGFAGGIKRHGFSGLEASHGVSLNHRSGGSTGQCQDPGKVFKGKKMPGHMGNKVRTIQNLEIIKSDLENNLIFVKGSVPGSKNSLVLIQKNVKKINRTTTLEKNNKIQTQSSKKDEKKIGTTKTSNQEKTLTNEVVKKANNIFESYFSENERAKSESAFFTSNEIFSSFPTTISSSEVVRLIERDESKC